MKKIMKYIMTLALLLTVFIGAEINLQATGQQIISFKIERIKSPTDLTKVDTPLAEGEEFYILARWDVNLESGQTMLAGLTSRLWTNFDDIEFVQAVSATSDTGFARPPAFNVAVTNSDAESSIFGGSSTGGRDYQIIIKFKAKREITSENNASVSISPKIVNDDGALPGHPQSGKAQWTTRPDYTGTNYPSLEKLGLSEDNRGKTTAWLVKQPETKYTVKHVFEKAAGVSVNLPTAIASRTEGKDQLNVANGESVTPNGTIDVNAYEDADNDGKWTFVEWTPANTVVNGADVTFKGTWTFTPNQYNVTYRFEKEVGTTVELPAELISRLDGKGHNNLINGTQVERDGSINTTEYADANNDGRWEFVRWSSENVTINKASTEFVGTWRFIANRYNVTYRFEKEVGTTVELPAELISRLDGKGHNNLINGTQVERDGSINTTEYADANNDGRWEFVRWSSENVTINKASTEFVGTWRFIANRYNVTYRFEKEVGTTVELPAELISRLDGKGHNNLINGTQVERDGSINTTEYADANNDGRWEFVRWSSENVTINKASTEFVGTWRFIATDRYSVKHVFEKAAGVSVNLPAAIASRTEGKDQLNVANGESVTPNGTIDVNAYEDADNDGKWTFVEWTPANTVVNGADVTFKGTWTFTPNQYNVTYRFEKEAGTTVELPAELISRLDGKGHNNLINGTQVDRDGSINTTEYADANNDGRWEFVRWSSENVTINKASTEFVGTWRFIATDRYSVKHVFEKAAGVSVNLPAAIASRTEGKDQLNVANGESVTPNGTIDVNAYEDADNDGKWTFVEWTPANTVVNGADVTFKGTWTFTPNQYNVTYRFEKEAGTTVELPAELISRLDGKGHNNLINGTQVDRDGSINTTEYADANNDGRWEFVRWSSENVTINKASTEFVGTWRFIANRYNVTYRFEKEVGTTVELPAELISRLDGKGHNNLINGTQVDRDGSINTTEYADANNDGRWEFVRWSSENVTINKASTEFVGTWRFIATDRYSVKHVFEKATGVSVNLPAAIASRTEGKDQLNVANGESVTPNGTIDVNAYEDADNDGKWTFVEWTPANTVVNGADVTFKGTWTFTPNQYNVTYRFEKEAGTTVELPAELISRLDGKGHNNLINGTQVERDGSINTTEYADANNDGRWEFVRWSSENVTINKASTEFVGTWRFIANRYNVTYRFEKEVGTTVELPAELISRLDGKGHNNLINGTQVDRDGSINTTEYADANNDGRWEFVRWSSENVTINKASTEFVGTWRFIATDRYSVKHVFEKAAGVSVNLPAAIASRTEGKDQLNVANGESVTPNGTIDVNAYEDADNDGKWTFVEWTPANTVVNGADVTFKGTWTFTPNQYNVTYRFEKEAGTTVELPAELISRLDGKGHNNLINGTQVERDGSINTTEYADANNDGRWEFVRWSSENVTINKASTEFVGTWRFIANRYNVTYRFEKEVGTTVELPAELISRLDGKGHNNLINGTQVDRDGSINTTEYADANNDGRWEFVRWSSENVTINKASTEFVGTWRFIATDRYSVKHVFEKAAGVSVNLPAAIASRTEGKDQLNVANGESVTPNGTIDVNAYEDADNDGKWTFVEWTPANTVVNGADVTFKGTWTFTPNQYNVTYRFEKEAGTTVELPAELISRLDGKGHNNLINGTQVERDGSINTTEYADANNDGRWEFVRWSSENVTINKASTEFVGTWRFIANRYNVTYRFEKEVGTTVELPAELISRLDGKGHNNLINGTQVDRDGSINTTEYADANNDGRWEFVRWSSENVTINKASTEFVGTWRFIATDRYSVKHVFEKAAGVSVNLPAAIASRTEGKDQLNVANGESVTPNGTIDVNAYEDADNDGKWTFVEWTPANTVVNGADVTFKGTWTFTPNQYNVTYRFEKEAGTTVELPAELISRLDGKGHNNLINGTQVERDGSINTTEYADANNDGRWEFVRWSSENVTINKASTEFVGTWRFIANRYNVTYRFEKEVGTTVELPAELISRLDGKGHNNLINGTQVDRDGSINTTEYADANNDGRWEFVRWSSENVTINKASTEFVGTWRFIATDRYSVKHVFEKAAGVSVNLPAAIASRTEGKDQLNVANGESVTPNGTIDVNAYEDADNDGKWTFVEWTPANTVVNGADVTFKGTWTFTPNQYNVTYRFEKEAGTTVELPAELISRLDGKGHNNLINGTQVERDGSINTTEYADANNDGRWEFVRWSSENVTINKASTEFVGTWRFIATDRYSVKHVFEKAAGVSVNLPAAIASRTEGKDQLNVANGTNVTPNGTIDVNAYEDADNDGRWTFVEWTPANTVVNGADVTFKGTWTFTPNKKGNNEGENVVEPITKDTDDKVKKPIDTSSTNSTVYVLLALLSAVLFTLNRKSK